MYVLLTVWESPDEKDVHVLDIPNAVAADLRRYADEGVCTDKDLERALLNLQAQTKETDAKTARSAAVGTWLQRHGRRTDLPTFTAVEY